MMMPRFNHRVQYRSWRRRALRLTMITVFLYIEFAIVLDLELAVPNEAAAAR